MEGKSKKLNQKNHKISDKVVDNSDYRTSGNQNGSFDDYNDAKIPDINIPGGVHVGGATIDDKSKNDESVRV